jgi:hypothetical protein
MADGLGQRCFRHDGGIMVISVPQLLGARHVPESAIAAALLLVLALLNLDHLALVEVFLVAGCFFANLYQSALGGTVGAASPAAMRPMPV